MDEVTIRPYRPEDQKSVQEICIQTSSIPARTSKDILFLLTMYNDCYTEQYPDFCFVAANSEDHPIGYILCAPEYEDYCKVFRQVYLPRLKQRSITRWIAARTASRAEEKQMKNLAALGYPAHMHIDILDAYQRRGIGTQLLQKLTGRLRDQNIRGLCLGVGAGNEKGISFYRKQGFEALQKLGGSLMMGLQF